MNRKWEHCEEKPEKSGIDVIRKGERMLESVARWVFPCIIMYRGTWGMNEG